MKKWYSQIRENDNEKGKAIKIGIVKKGGQYDLIASNGDDISSTGEKSIQSAIEAIHAQWGAWKTFGWIE